MTHYDKLSRIHIIDDYIDSINYKNGGIPSVEDVFSLKLLITTMEKILTPDQYLKLVNTDEVRGLLHQDNSPTRHQGGFQGSLGGFGTEELEGWQRMVHWPTP
jgi:hypothetical protein